MLTPSSTPPSSQSGADEAVRVLLVDDEQEHFLMTQALLGNAARTTFDLDWVRTYDDAVSAVRLAEHDVYLVDYFLEERSGLDLIREVTRQETPRPVIMLTGRGDRRVDLEAMKAGASDYLVKGQIDPQTLERSIRYALERQRALDALRVAEARHRRSFEYLPIGIFRIGDDGNLLDANPALLELLDYPDDDLLRNGFARDLFVAPEDSADLRRALNETGTVREFESRLGRTDGTSLLVRVSAWVHPDSGDGCYIEGTVEAVSIQTHPQAQAATSHHLP